MSALNRSVLMLNATFEPLTITSARHALTLVLKGNAVVQEVSRHVIHTPRMEVPVPDVIRLIRYRKVPRQNRAVSRKGILVRDDFRCQYCGREFAPGDLTLDHVTPKSRGGQFSWENLVACCYVCNNRKDNKTPQEAGMHLVRKPKRPKWRPFIQINLTLHRHDSWKHFLDLAYWNVELGEEVA